MSSRDWLFRVAASRQPRMVSRIAWAALTLTAGSVNADREVQRRADPKVQRS